MQYVPVISSTGKPLMPCHPARARELVRKGRAVRRFERGIFYVQLLDRADGDTQPIAVGIDPGSKKEGFTVKSAAHTYLNIQASAITWVSKRIERRRNSRRARRHRKTPHRSPRKNRKRGGIPPSTKARWQWKLRLARWLCKLYPVTVFVVEDVAARTREGKRQWNVNFSPLEVGKRWFYEELGKLSRVETRAGYETKALRERWGLKKSGDKMSGKFEAHCVDSWALANSEVGGHEEPDDREMMYVAPLQFHRRQLHRMKPRKGGVRYRYGGTRSMGFKRGSLVKHAKWGLCYVGGTRKARISLHDLKTGKRLTQYARPEDCTFLSYSSWRFWTE